MDVGAASRMLGARVSLLLCAVIEEYASAARCLITAGWIPLKIQAANLLCLLYIDYLLTGELLQPQLLFPFQL